MSCLPSRMITFSIITLALLATSGVFISSTLENMKYNKRFLAECLVIIKEGQGCVWTYVNQTGGECLFAEREDCKTVNALKGKIVSCYRVPDSICPLYYGPNHEKWMTISFVSGALLLAVVVCWLCSGVYVFRSYLQKCSNYTQIA